MHYGYEHNNGHHRTVATTEDPATALKGETFSQFFWKSFLGSYKSVYGMEKKVGKPIYLNCAVECAFCFELSLYCVPGFRISRFLLCFSHWIYVDKILRNNQLYGALWSLERKEVEWRILKSDD